MLGLIAAIVMVNSGYGTDSQQLYYLQPSVIAQRSQVRPFKIVYEEALLVPRKVNTL